MKIENETVYRSDDLKALFVPGFKAEGVSHKGYCIRIGSSHGSFCTGYAYYNSKTMCIRIPSQKAILDSYSECAEKDKRTEPDVRDIARTFVHELGHCLGLHHREMMNSWSIDVAWSKDLRVRVKPSKLSITTKPKIDIKMVRFEKAQHMLAKHASKLRRQQKLVKKWKAKIRYYERSFEKAARNERGNA